MSYLPTWSSEQANGAASERSDCYKRAAEEQHPSDFGQLGVGTQREHEQADERHENGDKHQHERKVSAEEYRRMRYEIQQQTRAMQDAIAVADPVNHPQHYKRGGLEVIDVIESFGLNFHRGNATKYILRSGHKLDELEDLKKARWYLDREIARLEGRK